MKITKYKCDFCGEIIEDEAQIITVQFPFINSHYKGKTTLDTHMKDICITCVSKIHQTFLK